MCLTVIENINWFNGKKEAITFLRQLNMMMSILIKSTLVLAIVLLSSKAYAENHTKLMLPFDSTMSKKLQYFYDNFRMINGTTEFFLPEEYKTYAKPFNSQEATIAVKGQNFGSEFVSSKDKYYELGRFSYKSNLYKLIAYNKIGECDTLLFNIQINSYDKNNDLVDALLLSSFYGYEEIERYAHFVIYPDYTINIDNYIIYYYEENEAGISDIPIQNPKSQLFLNEKYKIENGKFLLTSRHENSV